MYSNTAIVALAGPAMKQVSELGYTAGMYLIRSGTLKCSLDHTKRVFYRAASLEPIAYLEH